MEIEVEVKVAMNLIMLQRKLHKPHLTRGVVEGVAARAYR